MVQDGDIVNIDVTAYIDGVHGDTNATFLAGDVSEEHRLLVERTHEATMRAIKAVKPGRALSVVGRVIESYANRFGYNVVRDFTGHGIGTTFHNGLVVLHYDQPAVDTVIEPGMTFTIEPMINLGALDYEIWDDGWTVATVGQEVDGAVRAHPGGHRRRRRDPDAGRMSATVRSHTRRAGSGDESALSGALLVAGTTSDAGKSMVVAGSVSAVGPQGYSRRAVQGAEHVQQLGRHRRRRRDRPRAGHAGPRGGLGAERPVQPDPAQAGQRPHLATGGPRQGRRIGRRRRLLPAPDRARQGGGRRTRLAAKPNSTR